MITDQDAKEIRYNIENFARDLGWKGEITVDFADDRPSWMGRGTATRAEDIIDVYIPTNKYIDETQLRRCDVCHREAGPEDDFCRECGGKISSKKESVYNIGKENLTKQGKALFLHGFYHNPKYLSPDFYASNPVEESMTYVRGMNTAEEYGVDDEFKDLARNYVSWDYSKTLNVPNEEAIKLYDQYGLNYMISKMAEKQIGIGHTHWVAGGKDIDITEQLNEIIRKSPNIDIGDVDYGGLDYLKRYDGDNKKSIKENVSGVQLGE